MQAISYRPGGIIAGLNVTLDEAEKFAKSTGYQIEQYVLFDNGQEYKDFIGFHFTVKDNLTRQQKLENFFLATREAEETYGGYFLQYSNAVHVAYRKCCEELKSIS